MDGWYMGLITQIMFVLIYFFVSRFWNGAKITVYGALGISMIVYIIGILQRFMIDPLGMYDNINPNSIIEFISTLGQATWFSSYLVLIMPIGVFIYWYTDKGRIHTLAAVYLVVAAMTLIVQNSDSAIIAICVIYIILFFFSMNENKYMMRFIEIVLMTFAAFKFIGICQLIFSDNAVELSNLMNALSQGIITWVLLALTVILYLFLRYKITKNEKINIARYIRLRKTLIGLVLAVMLITIMYVVLNSVGVLDGTRISSDSNYLKFDYMWGNQRGFSWIFACKTFAEADIVRKLFGAGPDGFCALTYEYFAADMEAVWGKGTILTCAHNEWLTTIINVGLIGGIAYLGIFIVTLQTCAQRLKERKEYLVIILALVGYMVHNFFCYQQIICTPIVFIFIGLSCRIDDCNLSKNMNRI